MNQLRIWPILNISAIDVDNCEDNQCQHGATCIDGIGDYTCQCSLPFTGQFCESSEYNKGMLIFNNENKIVNHAITI